MRLLHRVLLSLSLCLTSLTALAQDGPAALAFEQSGGSPPPSSQNSKPR